MPFTFAHPAIVLPLIRKRWKWFSATGLIAGSIAPDFESFIGLGADKEYSHTWPGIIWFDLPIVLIISLVFHTLVKQPLIDNLPSRLAAKFQSLRNFEWVGYANANFVVVLSSSLLGILSHFFWDAFTHLNIRDPDAITSHIMVHGHRLYIILQYSNSIVGLLAIAWYISRMPAQSVIRAKPERYKFWMYLLIVAVAIAVFVFTTIAEAEWLLDKIYLINVGISALMYGLIVVSLMDKYVVPRLPK